MLNLLKNLLSKKSVKENLFIHIPKTGGSTFVGLLQQSSRASTKEKQFPTHLAPKVGNTSIEHVDFSTKQRQFKKPIIFKPKHHFKFRDTNIFMLIRDPAERLLSEFNFQYHILGGKNGDPKASIMNKLNRIPTNFEEYILNKEIQDYQCKFLIGRRIADPRPITEEEFNDIINAIEALNIHCGLTQNYQKFLSLFQFISGIKLNRTTVQRKKTPNSFKQNISNSLRLKIEKLNSFDMLLFNYVSKIVEQQKHDLNKQISIIDKNEFIV